VRWRGVAVNLFLFIGTPFLSFAAFILETSGHKKALNFCSSGLFGCYVFQGN
jgi:hypothetical protein